MCLCILDFAVPDSTLTDMRRFDNEVRITPSVFDRLLDYEPDMSREPPSSRAKSLRLFKQAVRRDLEWLLNTRQVVGGIPDELQELRRSLASYGLADFSSAGGNNIADQNKMRRFMEESIRVFEPRLQDVSVSVEPIETGERALRFRIDANLVVDPAPEPVTFDTTLQLVNGEYKVQES
jgi:type VI secretion system protein ImpF